MVDEIRFALDRYESALISVWQTDGMLQMADDDNYIYKLEGKQRQFQKTADEAKKHLIEVINKHTCAIDT